MIEGARRGNGRDNAPAPGDNTNDDREEDDAIATLEGDVVTVGDGGTKFKNMAWMPLHLDRWATSHARLSMSMAARGYYLELLMVQWRAGSVPLDANVRRALVSMLESPDEEAALWAQVAPMFPDGVNPKLEQERQRALDKYGAQVERAEAARQARAKRASSKRARATRSDISTDINSDVSGTTTTTTTTTTSRTTSVTRDAQQRVLAALEALLGCRLSEKDRRANARHVELLVDRGGLADPRDPDAPKAGPQSVDEIVAVLDWMRETEQPSADGFAWGSVIRSVRKLRMKWPKIREAMNRSTRRRAAPISNATVSEVARGRAVKAWALIDAVLLQMEVPERLQDDPVLVEALDSLGGLRRLRAKRRASDYNGAAAAAAFRDAYVGIVQERALRMANNATPRIEEDAQ